MPLFSIDFENGERAILVGAFKKEGISRSHFPNSKVGLKDLMDELSRLATSAGASVLSRKIATVKQFDPAALIGKGKRGEIHEIVHTTDADLVIFYNLLKPSQQKNLEEEFGVKVVDRKELILDIFAGSAMSAEGKLQVELAQLQYRLSRIIGKGLELSRTGGGIGTRGPGEKKLEVDRRRIRSRIGRIRKDLAKVKKTRKLHTKERKKRGISIISLVGYTNAGKSTLFNLLTGSKVKAKDSMFSTLDPVTRKIKGKKRKKTFVAVDTVGFIRDLPPELIEAFKATLEGIKDADLLLHVIDYSSLFYRENEEIVRTILRDIGAGDTPLLTIYNKVDRIKGFNTGSSGEGKIYMSAKNGYGYPDLLEKIEGCL